ncbi:MAG: hypothetical protein H6901_07735 [Rhodobacteraceae bacterium]|nr:hypothetical protein [Paracoccaceae bacterium]MCP5342088.1 hypothetical protein [Paracoccaceae bacterium]
MAVSAPATLLMKQHRFYIFPLLFQSFEYPVAPIGSDRRTPFARNRVKGECGKYLLALACGGFAVVMTLKAAKKAESPDWP